MVNIPLYVYIFPGSSAGKEYTCNARDPGSIPGSGRSPGEGNSYPLQYSGLETSMDYTGFSNTWTVNFQMFKLVLEKAEEPEIKLSTSAGSSKKQESSRKTSISAL